VTSDGAGNLFVTETSNNLLRQVVIASGAVSTTVGSPTAFGGVDGTGAAATFFEPQGVAGDGAYVADCSNHTIRKVVLATGQVTTVVGRPDRAGVVLGPLPAGLNMPCGVAFPADGGMPITDENALLRAR
jgi:hypothetical protein